MEHNIWQLQEAKSKFSELVDKTLSNGVQFVTRRGKKAVAVMPIDEYERLIDVSSRKERYLVHPLYHYRLAGLYEQKGAAAKAMEQYQKFLFLWQDADRNRAELPDAEKRLNALKKRR